MKMFSNKFLEHCRKNNQEKGFSLIEALIATAIVGIGFVGVYSLVTLSEQFTKWAVARQKLQMFANQMLEVMDGDIANIDSYNLTLQTCTNPSPATNTYLVRGYEWCTRMNSEVGESGSTDVRTITVTNLGSNKRAAVIRLEAHMAKAQIIMEKTYVIQ